MILYSIQRKSDKKKFVGFRWYDGREYWNDKGTLWRDIDSVIRHLKWLCSDDKWEEKAKYRIGQYTHVSSRKCSLWHRIEPKVKRKRLKKYKVVIHDVAVCGIRQISAEKYFKKGKGK